MKLCAGQYKYLLTVYELSRTLKVVRSVDIANSLSVTRPSVSRMLKCMSWKKTGRRSVRWQRMIIRMEKGRITDEVTELGRETAKGLTVNFNMVNSFFTDILKLDEHSAYEQSILFLSTFPEQTVEKLSAVTRNTLKKRNSQNKK